ncbi:hypothetical protein [Desertivirga xinjiangensis]|uniref:hypothetical protein n=1 Tax=Desertivirga xinjiangensis TaxID=539206 RepID=UPI0021088B66|nr:hypothetical protein [Pedobacter xinjiangensis]
MAKKVYGLKAITIGDIAVDGGMGTTLTEIFGQTVAGTAVLESTEPVVENIPIEESSLPFDSITTEEAVFTLRASTYNISADTMLLLFGGTVTGTGENKTWSAPVDGVVPSIEKSVVAETKSGIKFNFVRMKLSGALEATFDKTRLGQINWTGTVLIPTKAATAPWNIVFGVAA